MKKSALQRVRAEYQPKLPKDLQGDVKVKFGEATESVANQSEIKELFPHTYGLPIVQFENNDKPERVEEPFNVGIILSGGQAPGGHNVVSGIFDGLKKLNKENRLYGFLMGPSGFIDHQYMELTAGYIKDFRNTGGFDIIGSGRTKLEYPEQFDKGLKVLKELNIKALVIIGGDDSNTNAAVLAEYYKNIGADVQVIGVPKTIDGDLKNKWIETSFGFDTACKVYSEVIGNIQRDCNSAKKYYHFIKLMGRSASHIALECALETQPNICLISEEILAKRMTLDNIVNYICYVIAERAKMGWNFGTVLIPEGLIEFIPSMKDLIAELNEVLVDHADELEGKTNDEKLEIIPTFLTPVNADLYKSLPKHIALQLSLDRDSHGNVQVSLIETESLLSEMVGRRLAEMKEQGQYSGKFAAQHHFFGYEGRCADPTNFDADFGTVLIPEGLIEFIPSMKDLIAELNEVLVDHADELEGKTNDEKLEIIPTFLTPVNADLYKSLPKHIALQLSLDRDSHGNVQVSLIETESLLSEMVGRRLAEMKEQGQYSGKFAAQHHFFGYEGRCADPTNFDADYTYALGYNAAMLINAGLTGYMSSVRNLTDHTENWICGGIPITMMMNMERRNGELKPVIQKALVNLNGRPYLTFASKRETLALNTLYQYPGPIQYFGPAEICDRPSMTLLLEHDKEID